MRVAWWEFTQRGGLVTVLGGGMSNLIIAHESTRWCKWLKVPKLRVFHGFFRSTFFGTNALHYPW